MPAWCRTLYWSVHEPIPLFTDEPIYGFPGRVGSTPLVVRSAAYSRLLPPFGIGSVTVCDPPPGIVTNDRVPIDRESVPETVMVRRTTS